MAYFTSKKRILIIEDEGEIVEIYLDIIKHYFSESISNVEVATDGKKGCELMTQNKYDLIITDIKMPELSGTEVLELAHLLGPNQDTPVIMISAYLSLTNGKSAHSSYKECIFVEKPFDEKKLVRLLKMHLKLP